MTIGLGLRFGSAEEESLSNKKPGLSQSFFL
jgi:hypothetical protein